MIKFLLNNYVLATALSITSLAALAHQGGIAGTLSDSLTRQAIPGVVVRVSESNMVTSTDLLGRFNFPDMHPGTYQLKFSMLGYESRLLTAEVKDGVLTHLIVSLAHAAIDLSEVVVAKPNDIGSGMQTLNKIDIGLRPVKSSQDVLRMIPGLVTAQHAGGGKAEQIFLRGFDADHGTDIRLTVDGMPVNMVSHAHGQGYADLHFLTPEAIENVDFNKGPYYAQQGDFTTAGYASFNTKNSLDQSSLKLEAGRFDTYRTVGMFDLLGKEMKEKNQSAYISTEYMYTNGYFESPQNFNRINLMGKYHGTIGSNKILTVSLSTFSSKWDASGQIPNRAVNEGIITRFGSLDNKEGGNTSRSNVNMKLLTIADNGGVFSNQVYFINYNFELYSNFTFFLEDSVNGDQIRQKEQRKVYGYNGSYTQSGRLLGRRLRSEIGLQLRYDDINNIELSHTVQRKYLIDPRSLGDIDQANAGAYIDETLNLTDKLVLNAGLRFDVFQFAYVNKLDSVYNHQVKVQHIASPKLSLMYNASSNTQLYIKAGTGFHSNDARVVVADSTNNTLPRAFGADAGVFIKPAKRLLVNAAVWTLDLQQEFVYVGDEAVVEPSGHTRRYGADLSLRYQVLRWLFADADANYAIGRFVNAPEGRNYIPLAPVFTSVGGISVKLKNGFSASLRYRWVGNRPANGDNTVTAYGYKLLDMVVNYVQPKYALGLTIENIANVNWNEAQFDTESRMKNEAAPVTELHFTPGTPFFIKGSLTLFF